MSENADADTDAVIVKASDLRPGDAFDSGYPDGVVEVGSFPRPDDLLPDKGIQVDIGYRSDLGYRAFGAQMFFRDDEVTLIRRGLSG